MVKRVALYATQHCVDPVHRISNNQTANGTETAINIDTFMRVVTLGLTTPAPLSHYTILALQGSVYGRPM